MSRGRLDSADSASEEPMDVTVRVRNIMPAHDIAFSPISTSPRNEVHRKLAPSPAIQSKQQPPLSIPVNFRCVLVIFMAVVVFLPISILVLMPEKSSEEWIAYSSNILDQYRTGGWNYTDSSRIGVNGRSKNGLKRVAKPRRVIALDTLDRLDHLAPVISILQANNVTILPAASSQFTPLFAESGRGNFVPLPEKYHPLADEQEYLRRFEKRILLAGGGVQHFNILAREEKEKEIMHEKEEEGKTVTTNAASASERVESASVKFADLPSGIQQNFVSHIGSAQKKAAKDLIFETYSNICMKLEQQPEVPESTTSQQRHRPWNWQWVAVAKDEAQLEQVRAAFTSSVSIGTPTSQQDQMFTPLQPSSYLLQSDLPAETRYVKETTILQAEVTDHGEDFVKTFLLHVYPLFEMLSKAEAEGHWSEDKLSHILLEAGCHLTNEPLSTHRLDQPLGVASDDEHLLHHYLLRVFLAAAKEQGLAASILRLPLQRCRRARSDVICFERVLLGGMTQDLKQAVTDFSPEGVEAFVRMRELTLEFLGIVHPPLAPIFPMPDPQSQPFLSRYQSAAPRVTILTNRDQQHGGTAAEGERESTTTPSLVLMNAREVARKVSGTNYVGRIIYDFASRPWLERAALLAYTDVLIAPSGCDLSLSWLLPLHAIVVEITPPNTEERQSFKNEAKMHRALGQSRLIMQGTLAKPLSDTTDTSPVITAAVQLNVNIETVCKELKSFGVICT